MRRTLSEGFGPRKQACNAEPPPGSELDETPQKAVVVWTSDVKSGAPGKEFYSIIVNETIREDEKGTVLDLSARFCRALSCHVVLRNNPVAFNEVQWPPARSFQRHLDTTGTCPLVPGTA